MRSKHILRTLVAVAATFLFFASDAHATCVAQHNANQCNREGYCVWDADVGTCKTGPQQDLCYDTPVTECSLHAVVGGLLGIVTNLLPIIEPILDSAGIVYTVVDGVIYIACDVVDLVQSLLDAININLGLIHINLGEGIQILRTNTIPIKHTNTDGDLSDVQVIADNTMLDALLSAVDFCGVNGTPGNCSRESALQLNLSYLGLVDLLDKAIVYDMPDMAVTDGNNSIFVSTTLTVDLLALLGNSSSPFLYGSYLKNGEVFKGVISRCGGGGGGGGFDASTDVDIVDTYSYDTYTDANGPDIKTKISDRPDYSFEAVYLGPNQAGPTEYSPEGNFDTLPLTVEFTLTDEYCNPASEFNWGGDVPVGAAEIYPGNVSGIMLELGNNVYQTVQAPARASARTRMMLRAIDWNAQFNAHDPGNSCKNSSAHGSLCGVIACLDSATQAEKAFPVNTESNATNANHRRILTDCYGLDYHDNGTEIQTDDWVDGSVDSTSPCNNLNYNGSCGGLKSGYSILPSKYQHDLGCLACILDADAGADCGTDLFAIRPDKFDVNITQGEIITAGAAQSLQFRASDYNTTALLTPTQYYNESEGSSFVISTLIGDPTKVCPQPIINLTPDVNFTNGSVIGLYTFDDIGDVNLTIAETNGTEFSVVDADDTGDNDRFITPYKVPFRLIPDHFNINATLSDFGANFTYLFDMNLNNEYNGSAAKLDINISTRDASNNVTINYMATCYAKDTNVTMQITGTEIKPAGALTTFLYYNPAEANGTTNSGEGSAALPSGLITSLPIDNISTSFPAGAPDGNGTTFIRYKLNFDRKVNLPVDPFRLTLTRVDINDTDGITGNDTTTDTATFLYGRAHAPRYRIECPSPTAPCTSRPLFIYYEFYSDDSNGTIVNLRQSLSGDTLRSKDSFNWFQNPGHVPATDGNVTGSSQKYGAGYIDQNGSIGTDGARSTVRYNYDATAGYPYKATMEINASNITPWLIYNRFDTTATGFTFEIEFNAAGNETMMDQDVSTGGGGSINTSRRIRW